ncbi:Zinc finger BED domain-containing protein 5 [Eumeta japonica]|uniref:Zinc finger BED domain-containing protein 5 n=1 Tax=Eumeta variegata TaxID=151549 RepID=A0A4C1YHF5_EUMVA|nr:Zinc finger BED domain-containing protein 5 [Eumeta japonica]
MDELTDVAGLAILLVIVRYPYESSFEEDMLMCSPLPTNTTGEENFNKISIFFEENNLNWNDCIDICTDGIKAMTVHVLIVEGLPLSRTKGWRFSAHPAASRRDQCTRLIISGAPRRFRIASAARSN